MNLGTGTTISNHLMSSTRTHAVSLEVNLISPRLNYIHCESDIHKDSVTIMISCSYKQFQIWIKQQNGICQRIVDSQQELQVLQQLWLWYWYLGIFWYNDSMRMFQCLHSLMTDWPFVARTKRLLFILSGKVMEQVMVNQYLAVPVTKEAKNTRRLLHLRWWDSAE